MSADPTRTSALSLAAPTRRPRRDPIRVPIDDVPRGSLVDLVAPAEGLVSGEGDSLDSVEIEVGAIVSVPPPHISVAPPAPSIAPPHISIAPPAPSIPPEPSQAAPATRSAPPPMPPARSPSQGAPATPAAQAAMPAIPPPAALPSFAEAAPPATDAETPSAPSAAPASDEDSDVEEMDAEEMDAADFVEEAKARAASAGAPESGAAPAARPPGPPATPAAKPPAPPPAPSAAPPAVPTIPKKFRNWFENFFNEDYLRTVRMPTPRAVARECDFIEKALGLAPGAHILDVGCGLGLQAIELMRRGYFVVGLDLSKTMVTRANEDAKDYGFEPRFLLGDMREMTFDISFDAVLCWGTSFGYFEDDVNRLVLQRMRDALREGGKLLLDVANRDFVVRSQPNLVWFEGDGCVCMEETQFNAWTSTLEVSRNVMLDEGRQREAQYAVRLYSLHEISRELGELGFRVQQVSGSISTPGVFFGADAPRIVIQADRRPTLSKPPVGPMSIPPI